MRIQLYTLEDNDITWVKNGTLGWDNGDWNVQGMHSERSTLRLNRFLASNKGKIGDSKWLLRLSSVLYVPFVRFGDEIVVEKPENKEKKGKKGENQSIQDKNTPETDE